MGSRGFAAAGLPVRGSAARHISGTRNDLSVTVNPSAARRQVDNVEGDVGGGGDEGLSMSSPPYPLSPTPAYGREASLSLEILDYGDEEWGQARSERFSARASSGLGRFRAGLTNGTRRTNVGLKREGERYLEVLDPEPLLLQEHSIDNEESDDSDDARKLRNRRNASVLHGQGHSDSAAAGAAVSAGDRSNDGRSGFIPIPPPNPAEGAEVKKNAGARMPQRHSLDGQLESEQHTFGAYQYDDHGVTVNSDEENDIVQKIRHEITKQLRNDMKKELEVFRRDDDNGKLDDEENEMPQELKDAIVTMRKYDRILRRKVEREKEVKRQRIQLQKRLREELAEIEREARDSGRGKESRDVRVNADRFLSLAAPPAEWNDGADDNESRSRTAAGSVTPVFATQPPDSVSSGVIGDRANRGDPSVRSSISNSRTPIEGSNASGSAGGHRRQKDDKRRAKNGTDRHGDGGAVEKKTGKDFVKRNIELAADANNFVAMTDDEKRRLEALLVDLDQITDDAPPASRGSSLKDSKTSHGMSSRNNSLAHENSRNDSSSLHPYGRSESGFSYEMHDADRMADIDKRLQELMAPETWRAITAVPHSDTASSYGSIPDNGRSDNGGISGVEGESQLTAETLKLFTRTHWGLERDLDAIGEPALKDTHAEREARHRLQQIEARLAELAAAPALDVEMEAPRLSADQLQSLLEQCVRTLSLASHNAILPDQSAVSYPLSLAVNQDRFDSAGELAGSEPLEGGDESSLSRLSSEHGARALPEAAVSSTDGGENSSSWSLILDNPPPPLPRETLNYLLEQARREGVGRQSPSSSGRTSQLNADDAAEDSHSEMADGDRSAAGSRQAAVEVRRHAFSRLVGRAQEQVAAAFPFTDRRATSAASDGGGGGGSSQTSSSDQYRLPPLRASAADSPFLVQRYS